ncbi:hypothetical protein QLH52_17000, partial [Methylomonas sp. OY6]
ALQISLKTCGSFSTNIYRAGTIGLFLKPTNFRKLFLAESLARLLTGCQQAYPQILWESYSGCGNVTIRFGQYMLLVRVTKDCLDFILSRGFGGRGAFLRDDRLIIDCYHLNDSYWLFTGWL